MKSAERKTYLPSPIGTAGTDVPLTLPRGTLKSISAQRKRERERESGIARYNGDCTNSRFPYFTGESMVYPVFDLRSPATA